MEEATPDSNGPQIDLVNRRVVAVDGGAATGKGRLIDELSKLMRLKGVPVVHLSSGSLYRAVACAALESSKTRVTGRRSKSDSQLLADALSLVRDMSPEKLLELASERKLEMHGGVVWLDGAAASVDQQLKAPGVGNVVSFVASFLEVREFVNVLIRRQVNEFDGYVLIDGRDITHTVVPDAPVKLLLTVASGVAAIRSPEHTEEEIIARDQADRNHTHGALRHPDDPGDNVLVVPTDDHSPETVRDFVYGLMKESFPDLPNISD
jgi:cytidylate kinase